jgi:uncharacterized protein YprB with RNaseH-like and TPR domain
MSHLDKFAHIAALRPARGRTIPRVTSDDASLEHDRLAQLLGAQVRRNHYGEHLSLQQWHATPEICTPDARSLAFLLPSTPDAGELLAAAIDPSQWLFLDTETTGLSGGTGTYPFLVGIAWWDAGGLQVEQLFMRDLDEEHSILLELSERMTERPVLVTFNGKSFDWPLLETRYRMTRTISSTAPAVHLDLLHPARRIWRLRLGSVRLKELERHVLGDDGRALEWTRDDDIDSSLIPQMYFDYLRGGPVESIAGVIRHNQMDLRGLAALAGKILSLLDSGNGLPDAVSHENCDPIDLFGVSRILLRGGNATRARELHESALRCGLPLPVEQLVQKDLAKLAKRELDYARANAHWEQLRRGFGGEKNSTGTILGEAQRSLEIAIEATEQLAMYFEHRAKQPQQALKLMTLAVAELREAQSSGKITSVLVTRLEERIARRTKRLLRRCGEQSDLSSGPAETLLPIPSALNAPGNPPKIRSRKRS